MESVTNPQRDRVNAGLVYYSTISHVNWGKVNT
jgi:hypothetical protein